VPLHDRSTNRTAQWFKNSLIYIIDTYGNRPNFYRDPDLGNKPVFYFFAINQDSDANWAAAWNSIRGTKYDSIVLMDWYWDRAKINNGGWDGSYVYFTSSTSSYATYASRAVADGKIFVPAVMPGYDDRLVRSDGPAPINRNDGQHYDSTWAATNNIKSYSSVRYVSITSFNEWHEGTQIEPAVPKTTSTRTYLDYTPDIPSCYLDKTLSWVATYDPSAVNVIQCEDYSGGTSAQQGVDYYDTTPGNSGGKYRSHSVDIEDCSEGGYNVGWVQPGEWLRYTNVPVTRGGYQDFRLRAAAWNNPGQVRVCVGSLDNTVLTLTIPVTGGTQKWRTVSDHIYLQVGSYTVYLVADTTDINLNWFEVRPVIDLMPPNSFGVGVAPLGYVNSTAEITFSTTDDPGGSGISYYDAKLNGAAWTGPVTSPWSVDVSALQQGLNTVQIRAYDYAGNYRDSTIRGFLVDSIPPANFTPSVVPSRWTDQSISISFSTTDDRSGINRYEGRIGSGEFAVRTSPWTIPAGSLSPGSHSITIRAYDNAGNYRDAIVQAHYAQEAVRIDAIKALPDGEVRSLKGKVVTYCGDGFFYISEMDRTSGIRVNSPQSVSIGDEVELAGVASGTGAERYIDCGDNIVFVNP
jgi:hypothetical protein